jgi:twinkle protein
MNIHEKLIEEGIRVNSQQAQQKVTCPKCSHTRRNKQEPCLSVSLENDMALWHCHHCEWKGSVHDNIIQPNNFSKFKKKATVTPFVPKKQTLSDKAYSWLVKRGIDPTVITEMKLYTYNEKLCFPYYLDGKIVNIKYRTVDKRFHQEKDALKCLYNSDNLKKHWDNNPDYEWYVPKRKKRVIFVEGEMDVLSLMQIGIRDVVSLPDGAPKTPKFDMKDKRFTAFEQTEWIWEAEEVILCTDDDEAGKALSLELIHRFGRDICKIVSFPDYNDTFVKDANECLVHHGEETLAMSIANARDFPIEDLHSAVDYKDQIQNMYEGNVQKALSTGYTKLDEIYKVMPGTFNLITGIPNHGKSNFLDQILINLAEQQNWKFLLYSPEHSTPNHIRRLLEKRCRKPFDIGVYERLTQEQLNGGLDFLNIHFKFLEAKDDIPTIDYILEKAKASKQRFGIQGLVIDPFNQVSSDRGANKREDEHIRDIIAKCQQFARNHEIVVFMVAHPHKLHRNDAGVIPPPDLYQVSGSAHWANMADVGMVVHRDFETNKTKIITRKIREQGVYGDIGQREFSFNFRTRCYEQEYD